MTEKLNNPKLQHLRTMHPRWTTTEAIMFLHRMHMINIAGQATALLASLDTMLRSQGLSPAHCFEYIAIETLRDTLLAAASLDPERPPDPLHDPDDEGQPGPNHLPG